MGRVVPLRAHPVRPVALAHLRARPLGPQGAAGLRARAPVPQPSTKGHGRRTRRGPQFFTAVPDERPRPETPAGLARRSSIDLIHGYFEFAREYPALIETRGPRKGMPISWQHYVYGMDRLRIAAMEQQLRDAQTARAAATVQDDWIRWQNDQRRAIGD